MGGFCCWFLRIVCIFFVVDVVGLVFLWSFYGDWGWVWVVLWCCYGDKFWVGVLKFWFIVSLEFCGVVVWGWSFGGGGMLGFVEIFFVYCDWWYWYRELVEGCEGLFWIRWVVVLVVFWDIFYFLFFCYLYLFFRVCVCIFYF